jgi:hypothetical protein
MRPSWRAAVLGVALVVAGATDPEAAADCLPEHVDIDFTLAGISANRLGGFEGECRTPGGAVTACTEPGDVLRYTAVATYKGRPIDLEIADVSGDYEPSTTCGDSCNGFGGGGFGKVNVRIGTDARLRFTFRDGEDAVAVPDFYFSFFDFDTTTGGNPETLCVDDGEGLVSFFAASGATADVTNETRATACDAVWKPTAGSGRPEQVIP